MSFHWKVLLWMAAGALVGLLMQTFLPAPAYSGLSVTGVEGGVAVTGVASRSPGAKAGLSPGREFEAALVARGSADERGFAMIRRIRLSNSELPRLTLAEFKMLVR